MARPADPEARARILASAGRLFHEHGSQAVGLQQIVDEGGFGRSLLYREFASKDHLVAGWLRQCRVVWEEVIDAAIDQAPADAGAQLRSLVAAVAAQVADPDYQGCPFLNSHAEYHDPSHPAHEVVVDHFERLRRQLAEIAEAGGYDTPDALAGQLLVVIYGLYSAGAVLGPDSTVASAVTLSDTLIAGWPKRQAS